MTARQNAGRWAYFRGRVTWIRAVWRPHRRWVWILLLLTLLSAVVTMAYPLAFGWVIDQLAALEPAAREGDLDTEDLSRKTSQLLIVFLVIAALRFAAGLYPAFRALVNNRIDLDVRLRYFASVLRKGHRFFARFRTGDIVTRLTDDIADFPKIAWFTCSGLFRALESSSRLVLCLSVMLYMDASLAFWSLLPLPATMLVFVLLQRYLARATRDQRAAASATTAHIESAVAGVLVLQAYNAESRQGDAFARQLTVRAEAEVRLEQSSVLLGILFQALNVVGQVVVVALGGLRVVDGSLSVGTFVAFYLYLEMLLPPMMDLPNLLVTGRQAFVCMDRLDELEGYDRAGEGGAFSGGETLEGFTGLAAVGVHFTYPPRFTEKPAEGGKLASAALTAISLEVMMGERIAVIGEVGAGKSTLAQLLAGALTADEGTMAANGRNYAELDADSFRRRVGLVTQDPIIFSATVRENVVLSRARDDRKLEQVLEIAGLEREVRAFPDGVEHRLGLRGLGLSGGQRQRLAIARALYGSPDVLILDDITAALDAENEERFWNRLLEVSPDLTAVVVTHRPATARRMDRILVLAHGQIVEAGTHRELLEVSPYYQQFLQH